jgi:hypothetical protein
MARIINETIENGFTVHEFETRFGTIEFFVLDANRETVGQADTKAEALRQAMRRK